jgi:hypothetical protein
MPPTWFLRVFVSVCQGTLLGNHKGLPLQVLWIPCRLPVCFMRDNFIAPLPAEDVAPYWFTDTKLIKSLNYASIMLAKWGLSYSLFAVLFGEMYVTLFCLKNIA